MFVNNEETKTPVGAQLAARILDVGSASADLGVGGLKSALQWGIGIALTALFLAAPNAARADDECGLQLLSGDPETVTCDPNDSYPDGITYSSDGDLTLEVAPNDSVDLSVNEAGVNVTGNGADSIFWDSGGFTNGDITGTGIVLDYLSDTGNVDILIGGDIKGLDDATHAVRAESTGGGNVSVTTLGDINLRASFLDPSPSGIGIEALTTSGAITIEAGGDVHAGGSAAHAIRAVSTSGAIDIAVSGEVSSDQFGIQALSDSGDIAVTADDETDGDESAIQAVTGGDAVINIGAGGDLGNASNSTAAVLDVAVAGETTVNNDGSIGGFRRIAIRAAGGALTLNNDGFIEGTLDFSGLNEGEGYTFNNNTGAVWDAATFDGGQTGDLGAGTFNNAGTIELSNGNYVSAPGTTFTGIGNGMLKMSATILNGRGQFDCSAPTVAGCLDLTGGATAGQTAILVSTSDGANPDPFSSALDKPISPGIVLVDVGGGTSQADHFVLHSDSFARVDTEAGVGTTFVDIPIYAEDPVYGAVLETGGLFDYALLYNPNNQQHVLASVPQHEALEYAAIIHESLSVWHTTSDAVAGRQADLRDGGQRGVWVRVFTDKTERDFKPMVTTHGNTFTYDRSYDLDTRGLIAGYDLTAADGHVLGVHLGFMSTRLEHDDSPTNDEAEFLSGASSTFGAYAGWWNESGLTLDGTLNVNLLDIAHDVRDGLEDTRTNVITMGVRGEAGWRFPLSEAFYVQPLATAAYAYADVERLDMRDYDAKFEDTQSTRAALGVRLGGGTDLTGERFSRVKYWLTARAWEEYAEDGNVQFLTDGDPLVIEDDISEGFEEVGLGVSLTSPDENLEVFLSGNVRSGDHTDGNNVTVGARMRW